MTHGSLFAGIGGFDLGFERAGIRTVWQVEIDPYCRRVLAKHFPLAQRFDDIKLCGLFAKYSLPRVDIISGGFPCQDISNAGKRAGIDGERSGLWSEYARIIRELRPRFVVVENVAALLGRGMERVLGDLAACGYDAEWDCLPACEFGADHIRDRVFLVAYPNSGRECVHGRFLEPSQEMAKDAADIDQPRLQVRCQASANRPDERRVFTRPGFAQRAEIEFSRLFRSYRPVLGRGVHGIPNRMERIKGLGNAIVPQIAEWIGRRIMQCDGIEPEQKRTEQ